MYLGNIVGLIIVLTCVPLFAAILRIPFSIIAPIILVMCAIGAYTVHNSAFDVVLMLVFGVIGYVLKKCNYPLAPLVLAIVLGDKAEEAFRQSLLGSQGGLGVFFSNGLVSTIMALGLIALFWPLISRAWTRDAPRAPPPDRTGINLTPQRCLIWNYVYQSAQAPRASAQTEGAMSDARAGRSRGHGAHRARAARATPRPSRTAPTRR